MREDRPTPLDLTVQPGATPGVEDCDCEFTPDPCDPHEDTPEKAWHFYRQCLNCGERWWALHCPHDGIQKPCPACGVRPTPI